jgi:hypothetical protein
MPPVAERVNIIERALATYMAGSARVLATILKEDKNDPGLLKFMTRKGVLALGFGGETMDLLNPEAVGA